MKIMNYILLAPAMLLLVCSFPQHLMAQPRHVITVEETILKLDSTFWLAYNNCDTDKMDQLIADDVEFYHDKGGATLGIDNLSAGIKKNLCGNDNFRLKRDAVNGTVKVYPMAKDGAIYAAIIMGDHTFTILEKGKPESLDGLAKFIHLWLLENESWKMKRILSYDHGPATGRNKEE